MGDPKVKKGLGAWFPKSLIDKLSKNGQDFIASLMEQDVGKRLTAKEALQHPWLKIDDEEKINGNDVESNKKNSSMDLTASQFVNFATSHKFKFAITALFRDQYLTMRPKHFECLKIIFSDLDKDGNGKISYEEFEEGMLKCKELKLDKAKIQKMFKELDVTAAGEIEFGNLLNAAVHDYLVASDARLYKAFRDLDENESGQIKVNVLKQKMRELNHYGNIDMILQIIDDVDTNNDGIIDYTEFLRALHPDFNQIPGHQSQEDSDEEHGDDDDSKTADNIDLDFVDDNIDEEILKQAEKIRNENIENKEENIRNKLIDPIVKKGYMLKEGKIFKTWRKRWFVLQKSGKVSYYHNEHEDKDQPISSFNCKTLTKLSNKSWGKCNKKRYGIKVYTPSRNWKFLLQNNHERSEWIKAFETVSGKTVWNKTSK